MGFAVPGLMLTTALLCGLGVGLSASADSAETPSSLVAATPVAAATAETAASSPSSGPAPEAAADAESPAVPTPATAAASDGAPSSSPTGAPVYLTFDDGPDPKITPQVLDLLAAHNATATFFVQGSQVQAYPELTRRIAAEGHSVQNHAWNHPRLTELAPDEVINSQLLPTSETIALNTGIAPSCLRAPYGATSPAVVEAAATVGLDVVGWNVNPGDYDDPGAAQIADYVLYNLTPGSIVLLHDAGAGVRQQTVDALATLLPEMAARGFQPQALCQ